MSNYIPVPRYPDKPPHKGYITCHGCDGEGVIKCPECDGEGEYEEDG